MSDSDEISLKDAAEHAGRPAVPEHDGCVGLAKGCAVCARAESATSLDTMLAASRAGKVVRGS